MSLSFIPLCSVLVYHRYTNGTIYPWRVGTRRNNFSTSKLTNTVIVYNTYTKLWILKFWKNYCASAPIIIPPTTVGTYHDFNYFGHMITCCKLAHTIKILQNFWLTLVFMIYLNIISGVC